MSDLDRWSGVYREWVQDEAGKWHRYPIEPKLEWLWREEWDGMIFGSRKAMINAARAAIHKQIQSPECDAGNADDQDTA